MTKSKDVFTTITFQGGIGNEHMESFENKLKEYYEKNYVLFFVVQEHGAYGTNAHYHSYGRLKREVRTDNVSSAIRKLYPETIETNRHTVLTKQEHDPIYRVGCYLVKEADSRIVCQKGVDVNDYKRKYIEKQTLATSLLKNKNNQIYTVNQLPSVYIAFSDSHGIDWKQYEKIFAMMFRDNMIKTSQLKSLKWVKLAIQVLKGEDIPSDILNVL